MKQWFLSREPREQRTLMLGGTALALILLYTMVWEPITSRVPEVRETLEQKHADLRWMKQAAARARTLQNRQQQSARPITEQSMLTLVDRTAQQAQIREKLRRIQPEGNDRVRLWIEQAAFDQIIRWLASLQEEHGIHVESLTLERETEPGIVNARIIVSSVRP